MPTKHTSLRAKCFFLAVVFAGASAIGTSLLSIYQQPPPFSWLVLAALALLSFVFTVKVPGIPATISVSETFVFTSVLLFGTSAATVTVALDALIMSSWRHRKEPLKVLFNATEPTLSIWIASQIFFQLVGTTVAEHPKDTASLLVPVLILSLTYFILNSWLTAVAIGLQTGSRIFKVWHEHFLWLSLNYVGGASVAVLIVQTSSHVNATTVGIILPLLIISYLTYKSSMGRLDDADKHLVQVNKMYMSTIETLALAIDAKDQVTHGHIRRVQNYALTLSKALGVSDSQLLRAIEAAALLHDMGKLGIPEYILNKPGKLTTAEFEIMKTHAPLGADMLSAIDFPYPVVPIVRHHHENWDGTGYPDRITGSSIPIGARILAVVDCFDALTSDRPYRSSLSDQAAINILLARRGSMYDPLIVDAFVQLHAAGQFKNGIYQLAPDEQGMPSRRSLSDPVFERIQAADLDLDRELATKSDFESVGNVVVTHLARRISHVVAVAFRFDIANGDLVIESQSTAPFQSLKGLRVGLGKQLSGWVAAHGDTIMNSPASLDLRDLADEYQLSYSLSTAVTHETTTFGTITIYRRIAEPFGISERVLTECASGAMSSRLAVLNQQLGEASIEADQPVRVL